MQCITIKRKGSPEPSSAKIQDLETATTVLPSNGINDLLSRTLETAPQMKTASGEFLKMSKSARRTPHRRTNRLLFFHHPSMNG